MIADGPLLSYEFLCRVTDRKVKNVRVKVLLDVAKVPAEARDALNLRDLARVRAMLVAGADDAELLEVAEIFSAYR